MVRPSRAKYLHTAALWFGLPLVVTVAGFLPGKLISPSTLLLLYLCTVLFTSLRADQGVVIACALVSFLLFNFFHTEPRFSFLMHAPDEMLSALVFIVFALLAGRLSGKLSQQVAKLREQTELSREAERKSDEERLRSALLASVSHDLKTPLVTMLGAATSLRDLHADLSAEDSAELLDSIISEARRLESYIQNLLDMTRLGHGKLALSRAWVSVAEIWHVVEKRVTRLVPAHRLVFRQKGEIPVLYVHAALIEQALFNAIDNSLKAGGSGSEILVEASWRDDTVTLLVCDHGPGLPESEWEKVFDQFYTFSLGDCYEKGTGLGLSICRSIFRVHGGNARIVPAPSGFSHCLELTLPALPDTADQNAGDHD
jgi:two-component system sensor histidine kinase KdpD